MMWISLLVLQFLIILIGIFSHFGLIWVLVFQNFFDGYPRKMLAILSISMITVLTTFCVELIICLSQGTIFEDPICTATEAKFLALCFREYSQMVTFLSQFIFTLDLLTTVKAPKFHKALIYKSIFQSIIWLELFVALFYTYTNNFYGEMFSKFWLIAYHLVIVINWPMIAYAKKACRDVYKSDAQLYNLNRKHELYKSYETTKSLVTALMFNVFQQMLTFLFIALQYSGLLFSSIDSYRTLFILHLTWNLNLLIFPWAILLSHRCHRTKIFAKQSTKTSLTDLDGREIVTKPTQNDYFRELHVAWT